MDTSGLSTWQWKTYLVHRAKKEIVPLKIFLIFSKVSSMLISAFLQEDEDADEVFFGGGGGG
jgi:hypothetical protein